MDKSDKILRDNITQYLCHHASATTANIAEMLEDDDSSLITWVRCREILDAMVRDGLCVKEEIRGVVYFRLTEKGKLCKQDCSIAA